MLNGQRIAARGHNFVNNDAIITTGTVDSKMQKKLRKIQQDRTSGKISFDDAVKEMNQIMINAQKDDHYKVTEANKIHQEKLQLQQLYGSSTRGMDIYTKNTKYRKYLNPTNKH